MAKEFWFNSQQGEDIFVFSKVSRPAVRPTQPSIQWVRVLFFSGVKWLGHDADHSPQSNAEI
jgi:hypothetical protein